jgi:hypothetical protein
VGSSTKESAIFIEIKMRDEERKVEEIRRLQEKIMGWGEE